MVKLKTGDVNIGDSVIWESEGKRFLGKFESLFGGKMNVRLTSDDSLHTVDFKEVSTASPQVLDSYNKNRSKADLVQQVKQLAEELKQHKVDVVIKDA